MTCKLVSGVLAGVGTTFNITPTIAVFYYELSIEFQYFETKML
jgi:phage shock protein PspC (stress-responsive transcriptional regulator)